MDKMKKAGKSVVDAGAKTMLKVSRRAQHCESAKRNKCPSYDVETMHEHVERVRNYNRWAVSVKSLSPYGECGAVGAHRGRKPVSHTWYLVADAVAVASFVCVFVLSPFLFFRLSRRILFS